MITPPGRHMQRHAVDPAQYRVDLPAVGAKAPALAGGKHFALEHDGSPPAAAEFVANVSHSIFVKPHFVAENRCQTSHLAVRHYLIDNGSQN